MTVAVLDTKEPLLGDGVTTRFSFGFKVDSQEDLLLFLTAADGTETLLTITDDYTVTLNTNQATNPGGYVDMVAAPGVGVPMVIMRGTDFVRLTSFTTSVPPHVIEQELDRLTIYAQILREKLDRSLHVSAATQDLADLNYGNIQSRAGKIVGFNDQGQKALYAFEGGSIVGPPGPMSASRVEFSDPGVFRRESNMIWSHESTTLTFIWTVDGNVEESREITIEIDPDTAAFINPSPVTDFTITLDGTQLLTVASTFGEQTEYATLAIVTMPTDEYPTDTFTPDWTTGQFTVDPVGDVTYTLRAETVGLFLEAALTAESANGTMSWDAGTLPAAIRPSAARAVQCLLQYNDTVEIVGTAFIATNGAVTFYVNGVTGSPQHVEPYAGSFQTGQDKGLPAHWNVVYTL